MDGSAEGFKMPLTSHQITLGRAFKRDLEDNKEKPFETLQHLLFSLLFPSNEVLQSNKWNSPLLCFFAAFNMREDGIFKMPGDCTSPIAMLQFLLRASVLQQAINTAEDYNNSVYE